MKKNGFKKLSLNKEAIAKLKNEEMKSLKGGNATYIITPTNDCGCTWDTVWSVVQVSLAICWETDCCGTVINH